MSDAVIPYGRQWIDEEDAAAVLAQLGRDYVTQGPRVGEFEERLCEVTGATHAVVVSSGTAALHLAAICAGVRVGRDGITSPITFVASANCIAYCGGIPRFSDVDEDSALMSVEGLSRTCDELVSAGSPPAVVIPVSFAGQPADLPAIRAVAARCGAMVIEDAAHSLGAKYTYLGREYASGSCSHSDMAILSFHPVKHITTLEGGAILTNDGPMAERMRALRSHGITKMAAQLEGVDGPWYYEQQELGFHYRLSDVQCALGISQLRRLDGFLARRRALAARYDRFLADPGFSRFLSPLRQRAGATNAYHLYVVRIRAREGEPVAETAARRKRVFEYLVTRGVRPQVHYIPVPRQPWYRRQIGTSPSDFPNAERYYAGCLTLPLFPAMTDGDQERVVGALKDVLEQRED